MWSPRHPPYSYNGGNNSKKGRLRQGLGEPASPSLRGESQKRGFTIVELLTVIAIIVMLAAIIIGVGASVRRNAKSKATIANIKILEKAIESYFDDWREYPNETLAGGYAGANDAFYENAANVAALSTTIVSQLISKQRNGPYLPDSKYLIDTNNDSIPDQFIDAFSSAASKGMPLCYKKPGKRPAGMTVTVNNEPNCDIFSAGPDGVYGPPPADDDNIKNYD